MTGLPSYSTTASENISANTGINWDEGMPPATVNNSARQNMTDVRSQWNDAAWFQYGVGSKTVAAVYSSATVFTIAGADSTAYWHVGRRVRAVGSSTGTIYGRISVSAFAASTNTITVVWDSGSLSNETLAISASTMPVTGKPVSSGAIDGIAYGNYTPTITNVTNVTSSTPLACQYMRVGSVVTVSGKVDFSPTAGSVATELGISLPIASDFALSQQCGGTAVLGALAGYCAAIAGDATNNRASLIYLNGTDAVNRSWWFQFTYVII